MTKHSPSRETTGTDWPLVDEYFDTLLAAYEAGRIDRETFSKWLTHMIGAANNYGIEHVHQSIEGMFRDQPLILRRKK
jgi:hypothetical protein